MRRFIRGVPCPCQIEIHVGLQDTEVLLHLNNSSMYMLFGLTITQHQLHGINKVTQSTNILVESLFVLKRKASFSFICVNENNLPRKRNKCDSCLTLAFNLYL